MAHAPLHPDARSFLAREVGRAREIAEKGARASLTALAVAEKVVPAHFTEAQRKLRNRLRAHARQLGDERTADGQQEVNLLTEEVAYQHWHRMLFARFLAENGLLREDEGDQPIDLDECRTLAADRRLDIWVYAALCAQKMLPGVFRLDDPALELKLDGAAQVELNGLMAGLQAEIFKATDALGWVYQYWQDQRKRDVNWAMKNGLKVGAKELSPVTQLFTEDYMVDFMLHNTLGAWWAGKLGPIDASSEGQARAKAGLPAKNGLPAVEWTYLRLAQNAETKKWTPAGGTFDGWPKKAKDITFLDPCMGSGHFLVFALPMLSRMRMEEEGGTAQENVHYVLGHQIHGLELDQRCCQIGAFNLALTSWKISGFRDKVGINVACCGVAPRASLAEWLSMAGGRSEEEAGLQRIYNLFKDAPLLGSLINPRLKVEDLLEADFDKLRPSLEMALRVESKEDVGHEMMAAAYGLTKAANILSSSFTLVATNVPYLGRRNQDKQLREYCEMFHPEAKAELAACFVERSLNLCSTGGTACLLIPQNLLFLGTYEQFRRKLLSCVRWDFVCRLGAKAFRTPMYDFGVSMHSFTKIQPDSRSALVGMDIGDIKHPDAKAEFLPKSPIAKVGQSRQLSNPNSAITFEEASDLPLLENFATSLQGSGLADITIFRRYFWELDSIQFGWVAHQSSPTRKHPYSGMHYAVKWDDGDGELANSPEVTIRGRAAWGKRGVACAVLGTLPAGLYLGTLYDNSAAAIIPKDPADLPAIWCYLSSDVFLREVRKINQKTMVANATLVKVPFDHNYWNEVALQKYPNGLPMPNSSDPKQWLFNGHPHNSDNPLQVAVARLVCYRWPRQTGSSFPDCPSIHPDGLEKHSDDDGIVALSSINREVAAATRLRVLLKDAFGVAWRDGATERQLLADAGHGDLSLEEWLRDFFFEEHCRLFEHRPFIWHLWDGERDGFHALVNYHRLAAPNGDGVRLLQKLAQTYLGDWIARCEADVKNEKPNAHKLLKAAKDLQTELLAILEGEAPHDIFVRWKPIHKQPLGWEPDINDGIRINIRPFMRARDVDRKGAGLLRWRPNIDWESDRGREPEKEKRDYPWYWSCDPESNSSQITDFMGGAKFTYTRWACLHYTLATKKAARAKFSPKK